VSYVDNGERREAPQTERKQEGSSGEQPGDLTRRVQSLTGMTIAEVKQGRGEDRGKVASRPVTAGSGGWGGGYLTPRGDAALAQGLAKVAKGNSTERGGKYKPPEERVEAVWTDGRGVPRQTGDVYNLDKGVSKLLEQVSATTDPHFVKAAMGRGQGGYWMRGAVTDKRSAKRIQPQMEGTLPGKDVTDDYVDHSHTDPPTDSYPPPAASAPSPRRGMSTSPPRGKAGAGRARPGAAGDPYRSSHGGKKVDPKWGLSPTGPPLPIRPQTAALSKHKTISAKELAKVSHPLRAVMHASPGGVARC